MSDKGLSLAIDGRTEKDREAWEQARLVSYYSVIPHMKGKSPMTSIIPFSWDTENKPVKAASRKYVLDKIARAGVRYGLIQK